MITKLALKNLLGEKGDQYKSEIQQAYSEYTTKVSPADMTVSLETSVVLIGLCVLHEPKSILDLGSGFSSYVFRYIRGNHLTEECAILSIDTDKAWIRKTAGFIRERGLTTYDFCFWDDIKDTAEEFDLIFVDIDKTYSRKNYYAHILKSFVGENSVVVFDDMHKGILSSTLAEVLSEYKYKSTNIRDLTLDEFGRFSSLYSKITPKVV